AEARRVAGFDRPADPALAIARETEGMGLLEEHLGRFRLTAKGLPLADWVARRFLERIER
ncbi:MAG: hypothetical protein ACKVXR_02810, partial [Planctomycetota bacterium]